MALIVGRVSNLAQQPVSSGFRLGSEEIHMTAVEDEKRVFPSADSVTDPHLAWLLQMHERIDKALARTSQEPALSSTTLKI
jgi:hypothetical protein